MANRVLLSKKLKERRRIRKLPARFRAEYIPVGKQPSKEVLQDTSFRASKSGLVSTYMRGTTSHKEAEERARMAYLEAMFPSFFGREDNVPRKEVKKRVYELLREVPLEKHVVLERRNHGKDCLYFNEQHNMFFLIRIDTIKQTITKSIKYGTRGHALAVYQQRTVLWKKPIYLLDTSG